MRTQEKDVGSNRGTLVAMVLCFGLFLLWNQYLTSKYPDYYRKKEPATAEQSNTPAGSQTQPVASGAAPSSASQMTTTPAQTALANVNKLPPQDLIFEGRDATFTFSQELGSLTSAKLKNYRESNRPDSSLVELFARPASVQAYTGPAPSKDQILPFAAEKTPNGLTFSRQEGDWMIKQAWTLPKEGYAGNLEISFTNTSKDAKPLVASVFTELGARIDVAKGSFLAPATPGEQPRFLSQADGSDEFTNLEDFCKDQRFDVTSPNRKLDFFGFDTHYFAFALLPKSSSSYRTTFAGTGAPGSGLCEISINAQSDLGTVQPQQTAKMSYDLWLGPKEVELLTAFNPKLKTTLGLGWLDMIAHPLLLSIKGLFKFTGNYGVAIILLTVLLKILFFPLTKQAAQSAAKMKKLSPEMAKLKEKYQNDPQKMQMELMKFMSAHNVNPMKGCLPILPTIPVFFALFRVLSASIDLRHAPFVGWITDLSAKDPYFITPIILTVFMFIQQKMTPMTGMDKTQERVLMFMPLIFGVMMITLPSGLVLYMLTNTIVSIGQQQYLNRKFANI